MCSDTECRKRFRLLEQNTGIIAVDVAWTKNVLRVVVVMIGGVLGFDISGVV